MKQNPLYKKDYIPVPGFYDLRIFDLTVQEFKAAWRIQLYLKHVEDRKVDYQQHDKASWEKAKQASGELQAFLLLRLKHTAVLI